VITVDGQAYLDLLASPGPPTPRQANVSVTQQLVDEVLAAHGTKRYPRPSSETGERVDYERRAALAHRFGKVPAGKQLVVRRTRDEYEVSLVDITHDAPSEPATVPVPARVAKFHPLVTAFRSDRSRHEVSRSQLPRACRILHTFITEAERRGHLVRAAVPGAVRHGQRDWSGPNDGHLTISVGEYTDAVRIREEGLGSRSFWEADNRQEVVTSTGYYIERNRPISDYESNSTGRLVIELLGYRRNTYRVGRWADRKSWSLDDKVGDLLWEIEVRAGDARVAREEADSAAAERERRLEAARRQAELDLVEARRGETLRHEVASWVEAQQIRDYGAAMVDRYPDNPGTRAWAAWTAEFADGLDPLRRAPGIPDSGEIRAADLQPFLKGRSAFGFGR
jgi:hypothetical protein